MIIVRTHPDHVAAIRKESKYALASRPSLAPGDLILISEKNISVKRARPKIRYVMEFVSFERDHVGETERIWGKRWPYLVIGRNCRELKQPFDMKKVQVSGLEYGRGGPYLYVADQDEESLKQRGLLE